MVASGANANAPKKTVLAEVKPQGSYCLTQLSSSFYCLPLETGVAYIGWFNLLAGILLTLIPMFVMDIFKVSGNNETGTLEIEFRTRSKNTAMLFSLVPSSAVWLLIGVYYALTKSDFSDHADAFQKMILVLATKPVFLVVPLFGALLLVGVYKKKPAFLVPFLALLSISVVLDILLFLTALFFLSNQPDKLEFQDYEYSVSLKNFSSIEFFISTTVRLLFGLHSLLVVNSYHSQLQHSRIFSIIVSV